MHSWRILYNCSRLLFRMITAVSVAPKILLINSIIRLHTSTQPNSLSIYVLIPDMSRNVVLYINRLNKSEL